MTTDERLGALDAAFLYLERPELPMNVGALAVFDGVPLFDADGRFRLDDVRALVEARLPRVPRMRQRIATVPFQGGRPVWVDDPDFDLARHVRLLTLPRPGGQPERDALLALTASIHATPLERDRPLWELWFVDGLADRRVALIQKMHHALGDGLAAVGAASILLDPTPTATVSDPIRARVTTVAPSPEDLLARSVAVWVDAAGSIARAAVRAARDPRSALQGGIRLADALGSFAGPDLVAPRLSLNAPVGPSRRFDTAQLSRSAAKDVSRATGANVNEVVLAVVGGALAALLAARGELHDSLVVNIASPVSVRSGNEPEVLGNRVSMMVVPIPVGIADPLQRLAAVRVAVAERKRRGQARGTSAVLAVGDLLPVPVLGAAVQLAHGQRFANLVVSNVPGPRVPRFCLGAPLLEAVPIVPLARNLTLSVAVLSYCEQLGVGVFADPVAAPDLDVFMEGLHTSFDALVRSVGSSSARGAGA